MAQIENKQAPSLSLLYTYAAPSNLVDSAGKYSQQRTQLNIRLPIYSSYKSKDSLSGANYFQLSAHANAAYTDLELSPVFNQQNLYALSAGMSALLLRNFKNSFFVTVAANSRGDESMLAQDAIRFSGIAIYKRRVSQKFSYHVGAGYAYFIGRGVLFPALGLTLKTSARSRLNIQFPGRISYTQMFGKSFTLMAYLRPQGGFFSIQNDSTFMQGKENSFIRLRENQFGLSGRYRINSAFKVSADVGYALRRSIRLTDGLQKSSAALYNSAIENGPYFGIGLHYKFGKRQKNLNDKTSDQENEEIISDPNFYDIILN